MKTLYLIIGSILCALNIVSAQENDNLPDIVITPVIAKKEIIPSAAKSILRSKLTQVLTKNGVSGGANTRFVITPHFSVLSKEVVSSAPVKLVYDFEITLFIGDGYTGNKFESESFNLKGVGANETKAYISAIKNIKPASKQFVSFVDNSKKEILNFYNTRCSLILSEAQRQESLGNYDAAISELLYVPAIAGDCLETTRPKLKSLYKSYIKKDCKTKLNTAQALWSSSQNMETANKVGKLLSTVSPEAPCFSEVKNLYVKVAETVKEKDNKVWKYLLLKEGQEQSKIEAIKAIGVAYGENQPQPSYLISGWW